MFSKCTGGNGLFFPRKGSFANKNSILWNLDKAEV
jgi:hypothetical protein